ncbi:MAG: DUF2764 domain-containing protein [Bacteroidales bacterium]|jgi:hypothetical protein|nr:DUF2764 domain-containing protein [Bacteroidales bacterium]
MFKQEYHYLIAALPDLALERDVKNFDLKALVDEIFEHTAKRDHRPIRELFSTKFVEKSPDVQQSRENWQHFYEEIERTSKNKFIRSWFRFDQLLRNIQSAWLCRKLDLSVQEQLVGCAEDIAYFVKNNLPDFGLKREITLGEQIFNLLDEKMDMLEREFRFDQIRWQMADELTTFNYFDIDKVLAYLAKAEILDRWLKLDKEYGAVLFDGFVKTLVEQKNINL